VVFVKPRYQVRETIYIKEAWRIINPIGKYLHNPYDFGIEYLSVNHEVKWWTDNGNIMNYPIDEKLHSPMFLPEKFARTFLDIKDVRAERLKEITPADVTKEGLGWDIETLGIYNDDVMEQSLIAQYHTLWDLINGKAKDQRYTLDDASNRHYVKTTSEYCWDRNPWVWRIEFKKVEK
jgi:hypothetical protein